MNKDQVKGTGKALAGKAQGQAGKAVGSKEQQVKGHVRGAERKAQYSVGDVRKSAKDATKKLRMRCDARHGRWLGEVLTKPTI